MNAHAACRGPPPDVDEGNAILLAIAPLVLPNLLWPPDIPVIVLAFAQIGVQLVFFLHIATGPITRSISSPLLSACSPFSSSSLGSCWITANFNANMMPMHRESVALMHAGSYGHGSGSR